MLSIDSSVEYYLSDYSQYVSETYRMLFDILFKKSLPFKGNKFDKLIIMKDFLLITKIRLF